MNETDYGYDYDISYSPEYKADVIYLCTPEGESIYLTLRDLLMMLEMVEV